MEVRPPGRGARARRTAARGVGVSAVGHWEACSGVRVEVAVAVAVGNRARGRGAREVEEGSLGL
jgi:hypothetical protein